MITLATKAAKVLLIEDEPENRTRLATRLRRPPHSFDVRAPKTLSEVVNELLLSRYPGVIFDVKLPYWKVDADKPARVNGHVIKSGTDLAAFFLEINPNAPVCVLSAYLSDHEVQAEIARLGSPTHKIDKPLPPDTGELKKIFGPFRKDVLDKEQKLAKFGLLIAANYAALSENERLRLYKIALKTNKDWISNLVSVWPRIIWVAILNGAVHYAGVDGPDPKVHGLKIKSKYPTDAEIESTTKNANSPLFIFWNNKPEMREKVFKLSEQLPESMRNYFGISMVGQLADLYLNNKQRDFFRLCAKLNRVGKLEVAKQVFKELIRKRAGAVKKFAKEFADAKLPVILEIFKGEVLKLEGRHTAWVKLEKWSGGRAVSEPLDFKRLKACGVQYENQMFEYTIYQSELTDVTTNVEPIVAHEESPFTSRFE